MAEINLKEIFKQAWGYVAPLYPEFVVRGLLTKNDFLADDFNFPAIATKKKISDKGVSLYAVNGLYREVFMPVWLSEKDTYSKTYLIPNTTISITSKKNVVITPLVNRDGSVKEEISIDDWDINIKGVIVSKGFDYPDTEVQTLIDWYQKRVALNIQNAKTAMCLGETEKVIIMDLSLPEVKGFENTQPFELKLVSDTPFSLYID
jgi:hypothetical protein